MIIAQMELPEIYNKKKGNEIAMIIRIIIHTYFLSSILIRNHAVQRGAVTINLALISYLIFFSQTSAICIAYSERIMVFLLLQTLPQQLEDLAHLLNKYYYISKKKKKLIRKDIEIHDILS